MLWILTALAQEQHVLGQDSQALPDGRALDVFSFDAAAGQRVMLQVESKAFDPQGMLVTPDGRQIQNDDHPALGTGALVVAVAATAGTWKAAVTTATEGGVGPYTQTIGNPSDPTPAPAVWTAVDPAREPVYARKAEVNGTVQADAGNAWQAPIPLPAGGHLRAVLGPRPYSEWRGTLVLKGPAGLVHVAVPPADDHRAILELDVPAAGTWTLLVQGDPGPVHGFWIGLELTGSAPGFDRDGNLCAGLTFAIADARLNHRRSKPASDGGPASWKLPGAIAARHQGTVELASTFLDLATTDRVAEPYDRLYREIGACLAGWKTSGVTEWTGRSFRDVFGLDRKEEIREERWTEPSGTNPVVVWLTQEIDHVGKRQTVRVTIFEPN